MLRIDLGVGRSIEIAVEDATGGSEDNARLPAAGAHGLHQIEGAEDVDRCVVDWVGDALAHIDLTGEMNDAVEPPFAHKSRELRRGDAQLVEAGLVRNVLALAGGKVVDDLDLKPLTDK